MHDGKIDLVFAGDERTFRLGIAELLALEETCGRPISEMAERFGGVTGGQRWYLRDVREILRIGLQGGGMEPTKARQLLDETLPGNVYEAAVKARLVLSAGLMPLEDDPPGEAQGEAAAPGDTNSSPPRTSSGKARSSVSRRRKSSK